MPSIIVVNGKSMGNFLALGGGAVTIGRDERCHMQVLDEKVSRRHLAVRLDVEGHFVVEDLSANGVFVNGRRISEPVPLRDNDVIVIGDSKLVFSARVHDQRGAVTFFAHGQRYEMTDTDGGGRGH